MRVPVRRLHQGNGPKAPLDSVRHAPLVLLDPKAIRLGVPAGRATARAIQFFMFRKQSPFSGESDSFFRGRQISNGLGGG